MTRAILIASVCIFLSICAFAPSKKKNLNLIFIGDSITRGTASKEQSPPDYTAAALGLRKHWKTVRVSNQGRSGYTTVDFQPSSQKAYPDVKAIAEKFYQDQSAVLVFSIMLGTNDSAIKGPVGAPVPPSAYYANLRTITDSLLSSYPNCRIVFNYPLWYSDNTHNKGAEYKKEGQMRVLSYWQEIDRLVKSYKRSARGRVFSGDKKAYNFFKENYLTHFRTENGPSGTFYLHPNQEGDKALAGFWAEAIEKALKR